MPQVLPALVVIATQGSATFAALEFASFVGGALLNAGLAFLTTALTKKPRPGRAPINVTLRSTVASRTCLIGKRRVGGVMLFAGTSGTAGKYLHYVVAYAGHQCNDLKDAWLDNAKIPDADINGTTGAVSTASYNGKLKIWDHLGTQAQTVDSDLDTEFSEWTTAHRLRGICYRHIKMERDDSAFPSGAPQSISSLLEGALVYDPRLDTTNGGAGTHRRTDPQTWAYSANWALGIRHFLSGGSVVNDQASRLIRYGVKDSDARIDDAYTITAANVCDQSLAGANAPPSGSQVRYTLNMDWSCAEIRKDILEDMLVAGGPGQIVNVHGVWRIYAGAYDAPVHTFTQDDLFGEMDVEDTTGDDDRFNQITAVFFDEDRDNTEQTTPVRTNAAYVTQDGGIEIPREISLRGSTNQYRTQRLIERALRLSRQMRRVTFQFGRQGMKVALWETFNFSHTAYGWVTRVFRAVEREILVTDEGGVIVRIVGVAVAASVDVDLVTADYSTGTTVTNAIQSDDIDAPTGLTAVAMNRAIEFNWSLGQFWERNGISEIWEYTSQTPFSSATRIWTGRGTRAVVQKTDWTPRYYWVRTASIAGKTSATEPTTNGLLAAALPDPNVVPDPHFSLATDQSYWKFFQDVLTGGTPTNISISASGGVSGGVMILTGDTSNKVAIVYRSTPFQVITGQTVRVTIRWKRTNSVTAAAGADPVLEVVGGTFDGAYPAGATVLSTPIQKTQTQVAAVTVNQWQEDTATFPVSNNPKSSTQLPNLMVYIRMPNTCTGGTIHIDSLFAVLI